MLYTSISKWSTFCPLFTGHRGHGTREPIISSNISSNFRTTGITSRPGCPFLVALISRICSNTKERTHDWKPMMMMLKVMVGFRMRYEEVKGKCDELQRRWDVNGNGGLFPFQNGVPSLVLVIEGECWQPHVRFLIFFNPNEYSKFGNQRSGCRSKSFLPL